MQSIVLGFYKEDTVLPETDIIAGVQHIAQLHNLKNKELFLIEAAEKNDILGVKMWLMAGADINAKDKWGNTALMLASRYGHTDIVKMLIEAGANVNVKDKNGNTALELAKDKGHTKIIELLKEAGAKK